MAFQTLSSSVADAIEFLMVSEHPLFKGTEATIKFIRMIDKLFDLLNSRNLYGKSYKQPLRLSNKAYWENTVSESIDYLKNLSDVNGVPLITH